MFFLFLFDIAWQYSEKFYMDPPHYTNLKRPTMQTSDEYAPGNNDQSNGHIQSTTNVQSLRSDSVHFLNLTSSPAHLSPPPPSDESPLNSAYQPNYTFFTNIDNNHDIAAPDYGNIMSAQPTSANNLNGLNIGNTGTHQRRGSVQLWQFLVELLNEPEFR